MAHNKTGKDMGDDTTRTGMTNDTPQQEERGEKGGTPTREDMPTSEGYDPMADMDNDF